MLDLVSHVIVAPFTAQSTEYVTIANNSQEQIAFKVKTTAPKFYCVRPNAALLGPGESVQVHVILLGLGKEPEADFKCRDKFLVITLPAPYDLGSEPVANAWPRLETEFKQQAVSKKIKVRYQLDSKPQNEIATPTEKEHQQAIPAQVHEDVQTEVQPQHLEEQTEKSLKGQESSSPADSVPPVTAKSETTSNPAVNSENKIRNSDISDAKITAASTKKEPLSAQEGSLNSSALIMIAIIALVLGWLYY